MAMNTWNVSSCLVTCALFAASFSSAGAFAMLYTVQSHQCGHFVIETDTLPVQPVDHFLSLGCLSPAIERYLFQRKLELSYFERT